MFVRRHFTVLLLTFLLFVVVDPVKASDAHTTIATVSIEKSAHFTMADGSNGMVEPGTYQVEAADPWLRLIPGKREDALLLETSSIHHEENVNRPLVNLVVDGDDSVIQLLLPGGQGLEAIGSESGIRSRAVKRSRLTKKPLTKRQMISRRPVSSKKDSVQQQLRTIPTKNIPQTDQTNRTVQKLRQQVQNLQTTIQTLQNRLAKLESVIQVNNSGNVTITSSAKINMNSSSMEISSGQVKVNAGMSKFSGVVQSDTVITNSVVSSSYTPGAGNVW